MEKDINNRIPHSKDSERIVLGCMLSNTESFTFASSELEEIDFYIPGHKIIFRVLKEANNQDRPMDLNLTIEELRRINLLDAIGGISTLTDIIHFGGVSAYTEEYVRIIKDKSVLRKMINAAKTVEKIAYNEPTDVHKSLDQAQNIFFQISQSTKYSESTLIGEFLKGKHPFSDKPFLEDLEIRQDKFRNNTNENSITGVATHFVDLDKIINGANPSQLIIIAGRPGMGKTALGLNILENVCLKDKRPVGIFSLEMPIDQLTHRILSSQSEVEINKILQGNLSGIEFQKVVTSVKNIERSIMVIDDQPNMNISNLRARARRMKEKYNIELLMVDYLQLLDGPKQNRQIENRQSEISEISRMLKNLARELNIPVICLAQLSRKVEERPGHRPIMSDLRESGCLAYDSSVLMGDFSQTAIGKLIGNKCDVVSFDTESKLIKLSKIYNSFCSGIKPVFCLRTKKGHSIKATSNHKFLTPNGWTRLDNLFENAFLITVEEIFIETDQVESITFFGNEPVFDISVKDTHCFIANNLIVHNSIEQDADIILFLLRREYYDPLDKPGLAELIIAKNRHGCTGAIELAYRGKIAQFANLLKGQLEYRIN